MEKAKGRRDKRGNSTIKIILFSDKEIGMFSNFRMSDEEEAELAKSGDIRAIVGDPFRCWLFSGDLENDELRQDYMERIHEHTIEMKFDLLPFVLILHNFKEVSPMLQMFYETEKYIKGTSTSLFLCYKKEMFCQEDEKNDLELSCELYRNFIIGTLKFQQFINKAEEQDFQLEIRKINPTPVLEQLYYHLSEKWKEKTYTERDDYMEVLKEYLTELFINVGILANVAQYVSEDLIERERKHMEEENEEEESEETENTIKITQTQGQKEMTNHITGKYIGTFFKCFVSKTVHNVLNWEVLENRGDKVLWYMFNNYLMMTYPNIDAAVVTNMHQEYMSKAGQSSMAKMLCLDKFIFTRRGSEVGMSDCEDVFEALFGALDMVQDAIYLNPPFAKMNFKSLEEFYAMCPPYFLTKKFAFFLFENIGIDITKGKPAKTLLQEIGNYFAYSKLNQQGEARNIKERGIQFITENRTYKVKASAACVKGLSEVLKIDQREIEKILSGYIPLIYPKSLPKAQVRQRTKDIQTSFNEYILRKLRGIGLTDQVISEQRNKRSLSEWPAEKRDNLTRLLQGKSYSLFSRKKSSDREDTEVYWVLQIFGEHPETIMSSEYDYDDTETSPYDEIIEKLEDYINSYQTPIHR